jgi:hypothetical protein
MTHPTPRSAVLLVTLVALVAGSAGAVISGVGPAVAGTEAVAHQLDKGKGKGKKPKGPLTRKKITKIAKKQTKKGIAAWAPTGSVANSSTLGGQPPTAYQTTAYTIALRDVTAPIATQTWTLPAVPAGTYQATVSLTATMSGNGVSLYCALYQDGVAADLITAYGIAYNASSTASWRTVNATRTVAVSGQLGVQCRALATSGTPRINAVPANETYSSAQVSLVKLDNATALATAQ